MNISTHSLMMMNTINTEFCSAEVWFTDHASKALGIEDNVNLTLLDRLYKNEIINRNNEMSFARKSGDKYGKKLMDTATKTEKDAAKTASKRVVQKTAKATGDLIGNKIADKITSIGKSKEKEKTKNVEVIYIPPEKRQQIIDDLQLF